MADVAQPINPFTTPNRLFQGHESVVNAVTILPDGRRMVTCSGDTTLCLWNLKDGLVLKKMDGHHNPVLAVAVSGDGRLIASGDTNGELIIWQDNAWQPLTQSIKVRSNAITTLDFSPDAALLASGYDWMVKLWNTNTWEVQGNLINCYADVNCVRFSPSGKLLAIATNKGIDIWNPHTMECVTNFKAAIDNAWNLSLTWTPDGTRLLSAGSFSDRTIREWDTSTWQQVGDPWRGHNDQINALAVNSTGTFLASASSDKDVHLWRLSDRQNIAILTHSKPARCVTFSADGKYIFSGGVDGKVSEWTEPEVLLQNAPEEQTSDILTISTMVRNACINGHLRMAEELLTRRIEADGSNHHAYANRSFVVTRKDDWDHALDDAVKSVSIQPSLTGYISQGIAQCRKMLFQDAMKSFDLAFMFADRDSEIIHFLLLVKAIALFNANQHEEAMSRVRQLASACPDADTLACSVVEAYLHVQLGDNALDDNEAAEHFTAAINSGAFSSEHAIHSKYEDFVVLFGWDLKSLWKSANQKRCRALLRAGRLAEAHEAYRYMIHTSDEETMVSCRDWSIAFEQECWMLCAAGGDTALAAKDYNRAIELYSVAINLNSADGTTFAGRCAAKVGKMLWEDALVDAEKVVELNPSSCLGHELKHAALHGAQRYDEAIEAFEVMLSRLDDTRDAQIRELRQQYITPSEAASAIQNAIHAQLENIPHRLLDTFTGQLCDRGAQIDTFKASTEYRELLSSTMKHSDLQLERIQKAVATCFPYVMLSHRWEGAEPLLRDILDENIYELNPVGGIAKLQSFCETARKANFRWAWVDTCCIDQTNNVEVQQSVNSMFVWYRHSALTIVYLSDVPPSSKAGALAKSVWNTRGWTVQEFLAPRIVLFYQNDWTLYLDDHSCNHKDSDAIMKELGDATGIDARALVDFHPGMRGARQRLQWVSMRITTLQEDIAYSLFGILDVNLPVIYGEKKENALGRLLQEVVAQSGDITCLDWVGKSSKFNSCLPANIASYRAPPSMLSSPLSEGDIQTLVSLLQDARAVEAASRLYTILDHQSAPRFAHRRLQLPCIIFPVTEVTLTSNQEQKPFFMYDVKADGLCDLTITTEDKLIPSSRATPIQPKLLLVRPWDRNLLDLHHFTERFDAADDAQSIISEDYLTPPSSPLYETSGIRPIAGENAPVYSESDSRALRLLVRLRQPFSAFLLVQQWGGEYKRIASDRNIIAQVKDSPPVHDMMEVKTLELL